MTEEKRVVCSVTLVGGAYHGGNYCPGWSVLHFEDGGEQIIPAGELKPDGFNPVLDYADSLGYDTTAYRKRLDEWVRTGK